MSVCIRVIVAEISDFHKFWRLENAPTKGFLDCITGSQRYILTYSTVLFDKSSRFEMGSDGRAKIIPEKLEDTKQEPFSVDIVLNGGVGFWNREIRYTTDYLSAC